MSDDYGTGEAIADDPNKSKDEVADHQVIYTSCATTCTGVTTYTSLNSCVVNSSVLEGTAAVDAKAVHVVLQRFRSFRLTEAETSSAWDYVVSKTIIIIEKVTD